MYALLKKPVADVSTGSPTTPRPARKPKTCAVPADSGCSCDQIAVIRSAVRAAQPLVSRAIATIEHIEKSPPASKAFTVLFGPVTPNSQKAVADILITIRDELGKIPNKSLCLDDDDGESLAARVETTIPSAAGQPTRARVRYELSPSFFNGETARRPGGDPDSNAVRAAQQLQQTRLVIHEAAHKVLRKRTEFYVDTGMLPVLPVVHSRINGGSTPGTQNADSVAFFVLAVGQPRGLAGALSRIGGVMYEDRVNHQITTEKAPLLAVAATARWIARGALLRLLSDPVVPLEPAAFLSLAAVPEDQRALSIEAMLAAAQKLFEYHLVMGKPRKGLQPEQYLRGSHAFGPLTSDAVGAQRSLAVTVDNSFLKELAPSMEGSTVMKLAYRLITRVLEQHGTVFPRPQDQRDGTPMSPKDAKMLTHFIHSNAPGSL